MSLILMFFLICWQMMKQQYESSQKATKKEMLSKRWMKHGLMRPNTNV